MLASEAAGADPKVPWEVSAYERRWQRVADAHAPLEVCIYEAQILWGSEVQHLMREMAGLRGKLYMAVSAFARSKQGPGNESFGDQQRAVLYGGMDDDAFSAELQAAVAGFEAYVRPHLPPRAAASK